MKNILVPFIGAALAAAATAPAAAHSAPSILQLGGDKTRVSHGAGASCIDKGGVHVCGAVKRPAAEESMTLAGGKSTGRTIRKKIVVKTHCHRWRRLRTQGFYSGDPYPSRRFTRGFYADRIAAGH